jgi:hypothetical protein
MRREKCPAWRGDVFAATWFNINHSWRAEYISAGRGGRQDVIYEQQIVSEATVVTNVLTRNVGES